MHVQNYKPQSPTGQDVATALEGKDDGIYLFRDDDELGINYHFYVVWEKDTMLFSRYLDGCSIDIDKPYGTYIGALDFIFKSS